MNPSERLALVIGLVEDALLEARRVFTERGLLPVPHVVILGYDQESGRMRVNSQLPRELLEELLRGALEQTGEPDESELN